MADDMDKLVELIVKKVKEKIDPHDSVNRADNTKSNSAGVNGASVTGSGSKGYASIIDHTLLKPDATQADLSKLCAEARDYGFYSVCVNAANVGFCSKQLTGAPVKVVAVVGFPLGATSMEAKAFEAKKAVEDGAEEVDMVTNVGALKSRDYAYVIDDIRKVVQTVAPLPVKVIIESAMLTNNEKVVASALSKAAGAAFVKTSTGFGPGGATAEDIALIRDVVGPDLGVKASGGIHTADDVKKMIKAGATRIGASASVQIVKGIKNSPKRSGY